MVDDGEGAVVFEDDELEVGLVLTPSFLLVDDSFFLAGAAFALRSMLSSLSLLSSSMRATRGLGLLSSSSSSSSSRTLSIMEDLWICVFGKERDEVGVLGIEVGVDAPEWRP